jgi:hypothetical protein
MKKTFGLVLLGFLLAVPAHAQRGGGVGGGPGKVSFPTLTRIPSTNFLMTEFSGTETVTSTFLPFQEGIAAGKADLEADQKTLAEAAMENRQAQRTKAKFMIEQDGVGNVIMRPR